MRLFGAGVVLAGLLFGSAAAQQGAATGSEARNDGPEKGKTEAEKTKDGPPGDDDASEGTTQEIVRETPFGQMKVRITPGAAKPAKPQHPAHLMQVEEKGDVIVFKKKTPFGLQKWTKKRADLTAEDRDLLQRMRALKPLQKAAKDETPEQAPADAEGKSGH